MLAGSGNGVACIRGEASGKVLFRQPKTIRIHLKPEKSPKFTIVPRRAPAGSGTVMMEQR